MTLHQPQSNLTAQALVVQYHRCTGPLEWGTSCCSCPSIFTRESRSLISSNMTEKGAVQCLAALSCGFLHKMVLFRQGQ